MFAVLLIAFTIPNASAEVKLTGKSKLAPVKDLPKELNPSKYTVGLKFTALVWNLGVPANLLMVLSKYESGQLFIVAPEAKPMVVLSAFNHC